MLWEQKSRILKIDWPCWCTSKARRFTSLHIVTTLSVLFTRSDNWGDHRLFGGIKRSTLHTDLINMSIPVEVKTFVEWIVEHFVMIYKSTKLNDDFHQWQQVFGPEKFWISVIRRLVQRTQVINIQVRCLSSILASFQHFLKPEEDAHTALQPAALSLCPNPNASEPSATILH